ncbi:MAG: hypothetical protein ACKORE_07015, partial [Bacteroidota bacterium]
SEQHSSLKSGVQKYCDFYTLPNFFAVFLRTFFTPTAQDTAKREGKSKDSPPILKDLSKK